MPDSPIDRATRHELALRRAAFSHLNRLRRESILLPSDPRFAAVFDSLTRAAERTFRPALGVAYTDALREVLAPVRRAAVTAYKAQEAPLAAAAFSESLSGETAAAFLEALARAGFQVPVAPAKIMGPTSKQIARIAEWASRAKERGLTEAMIKAGADRQTQAAIRLRARASADRAIAEAINGARADAWQAQIDAGQLPADMKKRSRSQGDKNVRPRHRQQERMGAVPWNEPYPVFGVMHPPFEDGCRCYEEPVVRGRSRGKAQPRVPAPRTFAA
jgi:hypothetical protein